MVMIIIILVTFVLHVVIIPIEDGSIFLVIFFMGDVFFVLPEVAELCVSTAPSQAGVQGSVNGFIISVTSVIMLQMTQKNVLTTMLLHWFQAPSSSSICFLADDFQRHQDSVHCLCMGEIVFSSPNMCHWLNHIDISTKVVKYTTCHKSWLIYFVIKHN